MGIIVKAHGQSPPGCGHNNECHDSCDCHLVHQSPFVVRTVHSHGGQRKHLLVKGWYDPIVLLIQEEAQFQHYQHLSCLVLALV